MMAAWRRESERMAFIYLGEGRVASVLRNRRLRCEVRHSSEARSLSACRYASLTLAALMGRGVRNSRGRRYCRLLRSFPSPQSEQLCRLYRLELFWYEEGCMGKPDSAILHVDFAALVPRLAERGLKPFRGLVDGPVVFSGYTFFMVDA